MTVTRNPAQTLTQLTARVRLECNDRSTDTAQQTHSDADIYGRVNEQLVEMGNHLAGHYPGEALLTENLSYTSNTDAVALPAAVNWESIYKVVDVTDTNTRIPLLYVPPSEIDLYPSTTNASVVLATSRMPPSRYTLIGPTSTASSSRRIMLRPKPTSTRTLEINYLASPYVFDTAAPSDSCPLSPRWLELVAVGAARKLRRVEGEWTPEQEMAYQTLWRQFRAFGYQQAGQDRVRRRRRG